MKFNGFWENPPVLLCKTGGEGAIHVIYKKNYDLRHYQCMYLVLLCKTGGEGAMHVICKKNYDLQNIINKCT